MELDIPAGYEQASLLAELHGEHGEPRRENEPFYIVDTNWYDNWTSFTTASSASKIGGNGLNQKKRQLELEGETETDGLVAAPGPIDNTSLLDQEKGNGDDILKENLIQAFDFEILSEPEWVALRQWYGGGPELRRTTILNNRGDLEVEVYPYRFLVSIAHLEYGAWDYAYEREILISKNETIEVLYKRLQHMFAEVYREETGNNEIGPCRLYIAKYGDNFKRVQVENDSQVKLSKTDWKFTSSQVTRAMLEMKRADGTWATEVKSKPLAEDDVRLPNGVYDVGYYDDNSNQSGKNNGFKSLAPYFSKSDAQHRLESVPSKNIGNSTATSLIGACGLANIGNTCYMNASIQCLSHCKALSQKFIDNSYLDEISSPSEAKTHEATDSFAEVLKLLWSGKHTVVTPGKFKADLGVWNRAFRGYRQHDAEEFVSFILHKMSDEMKRPFNAGNDSKIEVETTVGGSEDDNRRLIHQAKLARAKYKMRNDSLIYDLFEGLRFE